MLPLFQILIEPGNGLIETIGLVLGLNKHVTLARIDDQLRRHAERLQRVPEFIGLHGGTFGVPFTYDNQGRRLSVLDEMDW
jgi:hypothetical protein